MNYYITYPCAIDGAQYLKGNKYNNSNIMQIHSYTAEAKHTFYILIWVEHAVLKKKV